MLKRVIALMAMLSLPSAILPAQAREETSRIVEPFKRPASASEKIPYGGTLVVGNSNQPTIINPILTDHSVSAIILSLVFNGLVRINPGGEMEPDLAKSWEMSPDGLVYTFYLREGVKFHDGVELTAEDVLYTYQKITDPKTHSPWVVRFDVVDRFEAPDRYTFRIVLKEPYNPFMRDLVRKILPKHLYEHGDIHNSPFNYKPVGTGPFRFKKWYGTQISLEANPEYHEGRPYLDQVIFKIYPTRLGVWSGLMRQEVDLVTYLNVEDYEVVRKDPTFQAYAHPISFYYALFYNLRDPLLSDKRVRQAVAYGINRRKLIEVVEKGYADECFGPFSKDSWGFNPDIQPYGYDPHRALRLLEEAGWKDEDGNGILEKDGKELFLRILVDSRDEQLNRITMLLRQQLQEVGIRMEVRLYADDETLAREGPVSQAYLRLHFGGGPGHPDRAVKFWHSRERRRGKIWAHTELYPGMDALINRGCRVSDREESQRVYHRLHEIIYEEQFANFLFFPYVLNAVRKEVKNAELLFNPRMPDYVLKDLYLSTVDKGGGEERGDH